MSSVATKVALTVAITIVLAIGLVPMAYGCSSRKPLPSPTTIVDRADAIYLVKADGYFVPIGVATPDRPPEVRFVILEAIKGVRPKGSLHQFGILAGKDDPNDHPAPYRFVRPAGRRGMCFATEYRQGAEYLLLLKSGSAYWAILAPTNEQVRGSLDPWVVWVKNVVARGTQP